MKPKSNRHKKPDQKTTNPPDASDPKRRSPPLSPPAPQTDTLADSSEPALRLRGADDSPDSLEPVDPTPNFDLAAEWFKEHERALFRYAMSLVHHAETARDAVQDTFVRCCEQEPGSIKNAKAWLFTVCRRRCYDLNARASTMQAVTASSDLPLTTAAADPQNAPDQVAERHEAIEQAEAFLERLPELQREALRLKLQAGLSYKQIAEVMGKSVSHVGVLIHEGVKKLRVQVADA